MLELSSPRIHTGLTARDVLVGCVAENDPRFLGQALRLVQSIRWFGGELAGARVMVCVVGEIDRSFREAFAKYEAEVRIVAPVHPPNPSANQLHFFAEVGETDREMLLLLDCDTVVVQDPLPWMQRGSVQTRLAPLPVELDFQLNLSPLSPPEGIFAVDPAILHYGDRVDPEGYLLHTPYPFAQVRIEAFNRRLREEREGRVEARQMRERPAVSSGPAAQVVVLGMHRSGTSALTGLLRRMGLWAGDEDDFPPADEHNEAGYWEHRGVWSVDEAILQTLGASWSEVADLDLSRLSRGLHARFRERAREVVRELDRHGSWVVKDPRLCLLFPFWREILERPFCVLIYREPLPVARSLAARDGFPISYGIALWEKYTLEALASTKGLPRVLISHRELMADPEATLRRLYGDLVRHRPELARFPAPASEEIRTVLNPALVHHPHEPDVERLYLTPPQLALLDALANGSVLDLDPVPALSPGARELLASYQSLLATTRSLEDRLTAQTNTAASLQNAQEGLLAAHQNELAAHQRALATHQNVLAAHQNALATSAADLQRAHSWLDELDAIFSAILDSRSWKIGRAITSAMGRFRGRPQTSASERRDRLMANFRSMRRGDPEE